MLNLNLFYPCFSFVILFEVEVRSVNFIIFFSRSFSEMYVEI